MGSSRRRKSTGRKAGSSATAKKKRSKQRRREPAPDIDEILGRLLDALSIISTAANAMARAQEREGFVKPEESGEDLITLEYGIGALRKVCDEFDAAYRALRR